MKTTRTIPLIYLALLLVCGWTAYMQFAKASLMIETGVYQAVKYYFFLGALSVIAAGWFFFMLLEAWREYEGRQAVCSMWETTKRTLENLGKISQESQKLQGVVSDRVIFGVTRETVQEFLCTQFLVHATPREINVLERNTKMGGHSWQGEAGLKPAWIGKLAGNELRVRYVRRFICGHEVVFYWADSDVFSLSACEDWFRNACVQRDVAFMNAYEFSKTLPINPPFEAFPTNEQGV